MNKKYQLKYLSDYFYTKYPNESYPEFESKPTRPYVVFLIEIDDHLFAVPFRTNMNHKYGYKFKNTGRATHTTTGLDFTKAVLVDDELLLGTDATIDDKEFLELDKKHYFIRSKFEKYYYGYKRYLNGELNEYQEKSYKYTTLKYYHKELDIK